MDGRWTPARLRWLRVVAWFGLLGGFSFAAPAAPSTPAESPPRAPTAVATPTGPGPTPPEHSFLGYLQRRLAEQPPLLDFPVDPAAVADWREKVAARLPPLLGMELSMPAPLAPKTHAVKERDGYRIEHVSFTSEAGVEVPAYVLIPRGVTARAPAPAVLCLQGVIPGGKDELAGEVDRNPAAAAGLKRFRDDFARQLARAGFITLAIDMRFDGERAHRSTADPFELNQRPAAMLLAHKYATMLGQSLFGLNLFDARRAVDYLETRSDVRRDAIGCAGFSFGSTLAAWLATIDRRVKVVALEGNWPSWRRLALMDLDPAPGPTTDKPWHWMMKATYQILPGFLRELDLNLTVASVAPTPMILAYESDQPPVYADRATAEEDIRPVRQAYAAMHATGDLHVVHVEGGHYWREDVIVPWLTARLRAISGSTR